MPAEAFRPIDAVDRGVGARPRRGDIFAQGDDVEDAPAVGDIAAAHGIAMHALVPRQATLEQAYLDLTGESTDYRGAELGPGAEGTPAR